MPPEVATPEQFLELARLRRTARRFRDGQVTNEQILALAEAVRWAPSAANTQPWELVVVEEPGLLRRIRELYLADAEGRDQHYSLVTARQSEILDSAFLLAVAGDTSSLDRYIDATEIPPAGKQELFLLSLGAAIQNLLLMATSLGLATTWIARLARIPQVAELLGIAAPLRLIAFVAIGQGHRPAYYSENLRIPVREKLHWNRLGGSGEKSGRDL